MKVSLPTISALQDSDSICTIESSETTSTGDIVYNYKFSIDATTNDLLNNDVVSIKVSLLPAKTQTPTNDFRKIASGDTEPITSATSKTFSSLVQNSSDIDPVSSKNASQSGGMTLSDKKKAAFGKNSTLSTALLKSHTQLKEAISENKIQEANSQIGEATMSVDSSISDESKKALYRSKLESKITSNTGDSISLGGRVSDIFFDGGYKISAQSTSSVSRSSALSETTILDTVLVQQESPSVLSNVGESSVEYEVDSSGRVTYSTGFGNISQSTSQDSLSGILERSGNSRLGRSSIDSTAKMASWSSIVGYGISPTAIVSRDMGEILCSAQENFSGTSRRIGGHYKNDDIDQLSSTLRANIEKFPSKSPSAVSEISSNNMVSTRIDTTSEKTTFMSDVQVAQSKLLDPGKYYVVIDLINKSGRIVQTKTRAIDHSQKIEDLYRLKIPPSIFAFQSEDSVINVTLNQMDPNGKKIRLFSKPMEPSSLSKGAGFSEIGTYNATYRGASIALSINPHPGKTVIFRAVAISRTGVLGTFSDTVVKSIAKPPNLKAGNNIGIVNLMSRNTTSGIDVMARGVAGNPVSIYFLRKNLTSGDRKFVALSPKDSDLIYRNGKRYQLLDTLVFDGNTYEYKCKMVFADGVERISNSSTIITRTRIQENISVSSSNPSVRSTGKVGSYVVSISPKVEIPTSDADLVKSAFENLGLSDLYSEEIEDIKSEFENITAFNVTRFDTVTGEEEDFGIITSNSFEDMGDQTRGISAPAGGREYVYKFDALVRIPDDIISEIKTTQPSRNIKKMSTSVLTVAGRSNSAASDNINFNFSQKFTSPTAIRNGTLSYGGALASRHAENSFEMGMTGISKTVTVKTPDTEIKIKTKRPRIAKSGGVKLKWIVDGNIDKIDHFIIMVSRLGVTVPVGTHHAISKTSGFEYTDESQIGILGDVEYSLVPVFSDYTQGSVSTMGSVVIQ